MWDQEDKAETPVMEFTLDATRIRICADYCEGESEIPRQLAAMGRIWGRASAAKPEEEE